MELTIKGKTFHICNKKRILYTICFFLLCLIDQRTKTGSGLDGAIEAFRNLTGVVMAVIIFSHYKWKEIAGKKMDISRLDSDWSGSRSGLCDARTAVTILSEWPFCGSTGYPAVRLYYDSYFYRSCYRKKASGNK